MVLADTQGNVNRFFHVDTIQIFSRQDADTNNNFEEASFQCTVESILAIYISNTHHNRLKNDSVAVVENISYAVRDDTSSNISGTLPSSRVRLENRRNNGRTVTVLDINTISLSTCDIAFLSLFPVCPCKDIN